MSSTKSKTQSKSNSVPSTVKRTGKFKTRYARKGVASLFDKDSLPDVAILNFSTKPMRPSKLAKDAIIINSPESIELVCTRARHILESLNIPNIMEFSIKEFKDESGFFSAELLNEYVNSLPIIMNDPVTEESIEVKTETQFLAEISKNMDRDDVYITPKFNVNTIHEVYMAPYLEDVQTLVKVNSGVKYNTDDGCMAMLNYSQLEYTKYVESGMKFNSALCAVCGVTDEFYRKLVTISQEICNKADLDIARITFVADIDRDVRVMDIETNPVFDTSELTINSRLANIYSAAINKIVETKVAAAQ